MSRASGLGDEQAVGLVVAGERESVDRRGHPGMVVGHRGLASTSSSVQPDPPRTSAAIRGTFTHDDGSPDSPRSGPEPERRPNMASTPMARADAYGLLPSLLILLMLVLASLGIVAQAASV